MISPRTTRLVRVPDLQAFQRAIVERVPAEPREARACAVIVPSRGAAEELRRTMEKALLANDGGGAIALPDLVTRDEFYAGLRQRLPGAPAPISGFNREVLLRRCAIGVQQQGIEPPFAIRAGLVAEILRLYDELRRRHRTVADFERLMVGTLEPGAGYDRGAARLLQQTRFLVAAFTAFEACEAFDEHRLRERVLASDAVLYRHVIVTVADQAGDRHGLWAADFDLLARMPRLERIDVVATEALLESGFHERLHDLFPGVEELRAGPGGPPPALVVPDAPAGDLRAFVLRDREEELADVARRLRTAPPAHALDRVAVVFQRPLPYLYLARQVFADAGVAWQALDSLPLAGEPFAAAIDVIFSAVAAGFTRGALVDLLRCPHLAFGAGEGDVGPREVASLKRFLVERKYLGGVDRLEALAAEGSPALRAAALAARELSDALAAGTASAQIGGLLRFIFARERAPLPSDPWRGRHARARAAVLTALETLRDAHAALDDSPLTIGELSGAVRRWIEGQTFSPRYGNDGVVLMDARAAAYADVDEVRIVGLTEPDWPERSERSIFYPQSLLAQLGWPNDKDRLRAARARFQDLARLPRRRISLSTFTLEDDAIVPPSPLLDDVDALGLPIERRVEDPSLASARVFAHDALAIEPAIADAVSGASAEWLALRAGRRCDEPRFRGQTAAREPSVYAISRVEKYLNCPFSYFAGYVLRLPEERDEQGWMTPQERGILVHEVFCEFFTAWQRAGRGAITVDNVADAVAGFRAIAEARIEKLPEGDRALERTLLLGSAAAAGLAERAFAFEIEDGRPVVDRLLEHDLEGTFEFAARGERHPIRIRSKADRIDLLDDGTLRVIDYKLGNPPDRKRALQLPIYGVCASQALEGRHGRSWTVAQAGYIAFKGRRAFAEIPDMEATLADGQEKLVDAVQGIERGEFPVDPEDLFLCNFCAYPSVCRKDYVGDE